MVKMPTSPIQAAQPGLLAGLWERMWDERDGKWGWLVLPSVAGVVVLALLGVFFAVLIKHAPHRDSHIDYTKVVSEVVVSYPHGRAVTLDLNGYGDVRDASVQAPADDVWRTAADGAAAGPSLLKGDIHFPSFDGSVYFDQRTRMVSFIGSNSIDRVLRVDGSMVVDDRRDLGREVVDIYYPGGETRNIVLHYGVVQSVVFRGGGSTTCMFSTEQFDHYAFGVMPDGWSSPSQCLKVRTVNATVSVDADSNFIVTTNNPSDQPKVSHIVDIFYTSGYEESRKILF